MRKEQQIHEPLRRDGSPQPAEQPQPTRPRVLVASLNGYRRGELKGAWLYADNGAAALQAAAAAAIHASDESDEVVIHASEGFGGLTLAPSVPLAYVADVARGLKRHGPAFTHWAQLVGGETRLLPDFKSHYFGHWPTPGAWAKEFMVDLGFRQELGQISEQFRPYLYVDYEGFAHDLSLHGEMAYATDEIAGVHVFLNPWRLGDPRDVLSTKEGQQEEADHAAE